MIKLISIFIFLMGQAAANAATNGTVTAPTPNPTAPSPSPGLITQFNSLPFDTTSTTSGYVTIQLDGSGNPSVVPATADTPNAIYNLSVTSTAVSATGATASVTVWTATSTSTQTLNNVIALTTFYDPQGNVIGQSYSPGQPDCTSSSCPNSSPASLVANAQYNSPLNVSETILDTAAFCSTNPGDPTCPQPTPVQTQPQGCDQSGQLTCNGDGQIWDSSACECVSEAYGDDEDDDDDDADFYTNYDYNCGVIYGCPQSETDPNAPVPM